MRDSTGLQCSAVGFYRNNATGFAPLSYTSTNGGSTWALSAPLPLPGDATTPANLFSLLASTTCDSTGLQCSAVGFYRNNANGNTPLSYTSTNGGITWALSAPLTLPGDATTPASQDSELLGVG